jgi:hypothetical protein
MGTFIYLLSYIPFNLSSAFDPIKNDIAIGRIRTLESFGKRITAFITGFFNFAFLDIEYAIFHHKDLGIISDQADPAILKDLTALDIDGSISGQDQIMYRGKSMVNGKSFHFYVLPVRFGNQTLACIGLLSARRISRFFRKFIMEFENNFLDDQLMHVINYSK